MPNSLLPVAEVGQGFPESREKFARPMPSRLGNVDDLMVSYRFDIARRLNDAAANDQIVAPLLKEAALELLRTTLSYGQSTHDIEIFKVRRKLRLRCRGGAILLLCLLEDPGKVYSYDELAAISCPRAPNTNTIKVYVNDVRNGLLRLGIHDAIRVQRGSGYFLERSAAAAVIFAIR